MKLYSRRSSRIETLDPRLCLANVPPSAQEQYMVELINRARANPPQYAVDFNLPVSLTDASPRPPLAVNGFLTDSSRGHAVEMATFNYFAHTSAVTGKAPNRMARDAGYVLPGFYPDDQNFIESLAAGSFLSYQSAVAPLNALLVDQGLNPPGHRIHLLAMDPFYETHNEIGVGYGFGSSSSFQNYWAIQTGPDSLGREFLTGVVYSDTVSADNFYTPGEGKGAVEVRATRISDNMEFVATTYGSGGYSLPLTAGVYNVTASGGELASPITVNNITIGSSNVKQDFVASAVPVGPSVTAKQFLVDASVQTLQFDFSQPVAGLTASDLVLEQLGSPNQTIPSANIAMVLNGAQQQANFTFPGYAAGALPDGNYVAALPAGSFTNGLGNPSVAASLDFFVLAGDANRDRSVNLDDFTILAANFGQTGQVFSEGNFDYDPAGAVNLDDFTILASQFGASLPAPGDLPRREPASLPLSPFSAERVARPVSRVMSPDELLGTGDAPTYI
ncbi:MAG TPA: hypothetical protein PLD59_04385 [Tepidisphaeraceae bacterium]|nr:hypothetical protein [Tepidisphaeraceae bacterium]